MSSIITHIYTSNIIKEKYNFSNDFLVGAIFPDVLKMHKRETRIETHYSVIYKTEDKELELPNIESYLYDNKYNMTNDLKKGYLVHLIEDNLWFEKYINKYTKKVNEKIIYLPDNSEMTEEEFSTAMHSDYPLVDRYIINKSDFKYERVNENAHKTLKGFDREIDTLIRLYPKEKDELDIVSYEDMDNYIKESCEIIEQYMKRKDIKW